MGENSGWISERNGAASYGTYFHENLNVNFLQCECESTLAVHNVVRDIAVLVARAAPIFLVNVFDQLLSVSGQTSHPFGIADFSSIC